MLSPHIIHSKLNIIRYVIYLLIVLLAFSPLTTGSAQTEQPSGPIYVVQEGDSLWGIAARFGVSVDDLLAVNNIGNANQLNVGMNLVIPGLGNIQGTIVTETLPYGETLRSIERRYQIPQDTIVRLNRLTSPSEIYAGLTFILPEQSTQAPALARDTIQPGQSLLEFAVLHAVAPWSLVNSNTLTNTLSTLPGDVLRIPGKMAEGPGALPGSITGIDVSPLSLKQGKVAEIKISTDNELSLSGSLLGHDLQFYPNEGKGYTALQGVHAMTEPGIYPLVINMKFPDNNEYSFTQMVPVKAVDYPYDQPLAVDPATIDPAVTGPEDAQWSALASTSTSEKYWNGLFKIPSPLDQNYCVQTGDCWASRYGNRRSYNGSAYNYFHTGLDIVGKTGTDIYAPADGVVVFTGPLTVRGNATMINHGWGVYTGYMHQSEILVKPGDFVKAGQLIGKVGGTGRVQGPHLHWEVWVNGIQVDPLDWLSEIYP